MPRRKTKPPLVHLSSEAKSAGSSAFSPTMLYKRPIVYMVPLHEVDEMSKEDWIFEFFSILSSGVLGYVLTIDMKNLQTTLLIIFAAMLLIYHIIRLYLKSRQMRNLKKNALPWIADVQTIGGSSHQIDG